MLMVLLVRPIPRRGGGWEARPRLQRPTWEGTRRPTGDCGGHRKEEVPFGCLALVLLAIYGFRDHVTNFSFYLDLAPLPATNVNLNHRVLFDGGKNCGI